METAIDIEAYDGSRISVAVDPASLEIYVGGTPQFGLEEALAYFEEIVAEIKKHL